MTLHRLLGVLALAPAIAQGQDIDYGSIDAFVVPQASLAARWPASAGIDEDGTGFGLRTLSRATDALVVLAEAQTLSFDTVDALQVRIGAGLANASTSGAYLTYDRLDLDRDAANMLGLHLRAAGRPSERFSLYLDVAYLAADGDSFYYDGGELTAGATLDLKRPWGFFAEYRAMLLEDRDNDDRLDLRQLRAGLRYRFDC